MYGSRPSVVVCALGLLLAGPLAGCGAESPPPRTPPTPTPRVSPTPSGEAKTTPQPLTLSSPAFRNGARIPKKHACKPEGENVSPPLAWTGAPAATRELALLCDDPDAPRAEPWVHWVLYGIPADRTSLAEGETGVGVAGKNDWKKTEWGGPLPPAGSGVHHYHFRLYALDAPLQLAPGATKPELLAALEGHVLATAELVGTYERKK
jgi:hypothetical protein